MISFELMASYFVDIRFFMWDAMKTCPPKLSSYAINVLTNVFMFILRQMDSHERHIMLMLIASIYPAERLIKLVNEFIITEPTLHAVGTFYEYYRYPNYIIEKRFLHESNYYSHSHALYNYIRATYHSLPHKRRDKLVDKLIEIGSIEDLFSFFKYIDDSHPKVIEKLKQTSVTRSSLWQKKFNK